MRPAFSSTKQAASFALLLLLLLSSPWLAGKRFLPPREQAYATAGWAEGPYPWMEKQIFLETNDIDIVFMGSSSMEWAIDTPYVQEKLDEHLGRKSVVRSICWTKVGFDALYFAAKDLLERRHVKTLVFYDQAEKTLPASGTVNWYRFGDDAALLSGLQFRYKAYYYFAATVGMQRNFLAMLSPNLPEETNNTDPSYCELSWHAANPENRLGAITAQVGFHQSDGAEPFVPYLPKTGVTPSDVSIYAPATASNFAFSDQPLPSWQIYFLKRFALEAGKHGCKLVLLHIPFMKEKQSLKINESAYWPDALQTDVAMLGIPTGRLFAGMSEDDVKRLFYNSQHLNQNGSKYFTPLVVPALLQLHEGKSHD